MCRVATLLLLLLLPLSAVASTAGPVVRAELDRESVEVGETIRLRLTVLVPTWFKQPPRYPDFAIANAMTQLPPDSSFPISETIDDVAWSGIVRDYRIVPLVAGSYQLPAGVVHVRFVDPDGGGVHAVDQPVPSIRFRATVPLGAESLDPYVGGTELHLEREIDGAVEDLAVGGALVVRYTAELAGATALMLPPLLDRFDEPGVSAYPREPVVEDGDVGRRVEQVTYVFDTAGRHTLPGSELRWWNSGEKRVEVARVEPLEVAVAGGLGSAVAGRGQRPWWAVGLLVVGGLLAGASARRLRVVAEAKWQDWLVSEPRAYRSLRKALRGGDRREAYAALLAWLARLPEASGVDDVAELTGQPQLAILADRLAASLFGSADSKVDLRGLTESIARARSVLRSQRHRSKAGDVLPSLNPAAHEGG